MVSRSFLLALSLIVTGCGGQSFESVDGGGGGSGGAGAAAGSGGHGGSGAMGGSGGTGAVGGSGGTGAVGGSGGTGGMPPECRGPVTEPGPYPSTLRFVNPLRSSLWLREECELRWQLYSCADGYQQALSHSAMCTSACDDVVNGGCIVCGACMVGAREVTSAQPAEVAWQGSVYDFDTVQGCYCHREQNPLPGKYRFTTQVYATEQEAREGSAAGRTVSVEVELPAPGGVVTIDLSQLDPPQP